MPVLGATNGNKNFSRRVIRGLYRKFIETVTEKGRPWLSKKRVATFTKAMESAVGVALMLFLHNLDRETELPEFREYAYEKYPELDEDLITMI